MRRLLSGLLALLLVVAAPAQAAFQVNNLVGFGVKPAAAGGGDIAVTDDGSASDTANLTTHTFASQTSTGPATILLVSWRDNSTHTLDSFTWNGNAMTALINDGGAANETGAAILYIAGAQSGTISLTFNQAVNPVNITKLSLSNLLSPTAVDTDIDEGTGTTGTLAALASPGAGGVRLALYTNLTEGTAISWTNATEVSDLEDGGANAIRHSVAYDLGADATSISAVGASAYHTIVGVSLR